MTKVATNRPALALWFATAAVLAGTIDMMQVAAVARGAELGRLTAMVLSIYAVLGIASSLLLIPLAARLPRPWHEPGALLGLAFAFWSTVLAAAYLNVVHLPPVTEPLTMAVNLAMAAAAVGLWRAGVAWPRAALLARSPVAAAATMATAVIIAISMAAAEPRTSSEPRGETTRAAADAPNVFVVIIDTLRHDRASGDTGRRLMPTLSALSDGGTNFSRAYVQATWTKPSVASIFTSLFPSTHQANLRRDRLSQEPATLATVFNGAGYDTAAFSANPWISPAFGFGRGVGHFFESDRESFTRLVMLLRILKTPDRMTASKPISATLRAVETLYGVRTSRKNNCERDLAIAGDFENWVGGKTDRPLFAYFHLMSPHIPYLPPGREQEYPASEQVRLLLSREPLAPDRHRLLVSLYEDSVRHADTVLAALLATIERAGTGRSSLVVVSSDHGEEFFEHGRWGHGKSHYEELSHVPMIVSGPGFEPGGKVDRPVMAVDILPTLAAAARPGPAPEVWEGAPMDSDESGDGTVREVMGELIREGGFETSMLLSGLDKYIETKDGLGHQTRHELYDLAVDPGETDNLYAVGPGDWAARLESRRAQSRAKKVEAAAQIELDDAQREKLEALGYVN